MNAPFTISLEQLRALKPCKDEYKVVAPMLDDGPLNAAQAVEKGATLDHLIWVAVEVGKTNEQVERRLRLFATDCAAHILHIYENKYDNPAPRLAIETTRRCVDGLETLDELDAARAAAWTAARAAAQDARWGAAWAGQVAARAATRTAAWTAAWAGGAGGDAEYQRQLDRLVYWLMEENPEVLPLPEKLDREGVE